MPQSIPIVGWLLLAIRAVALPQPGENVLIGRDSNSTATANAAGPSLFSLHSSRVGNDSAQQPEDYEFQRGSDGKYFYTGTPPLPDGANKTYLNLQTSFFNDSAGLCGPAGGDLWKLTPQNWAAAKTSENLRRFIQGQRDTEGLQWLPNNDNPPLPFTAWLGRQMTNKASYNCSLENPCDDDLNCDTIGQGRRDGSAGFIRSRWGYFALVAFRNMNLQLGNTYGSLDGAQIDNTLATFTVNDFFPKKDQQFALRNFLSGLGTFFGIAAGFIPGIGGIALGTAGAIAPAFGGFLGNAISANTDPDASSKIYSDYVRKTYMAIRRGLDEGAATIFSGGSIGDPAVNITMMLEGGYWLNSSQLAPVATLTNSTAKEMFARSINALWKTFSSNKIYITYLDLQDPTNDKCNKDMSGPQDSKYCSDSGVYYLYNWIEEDVTLGSGRPGYPWGAQDLYAKTGISLPRIVESSVRSSLIAKNTTGSRYSFDQLSGTKRILEDAIANPGQLPGILGDAGHLPGTWTIPVCNMSTWGQRWNAAYDGSSNRNSIRRTIPCICGPGGSETAAWVEAAGLKNYGQYHAFCENEIGKKSSGFVWPDGITQVDPGYGGIIKKPR